MELIGKTKGQFFGALLIIVLIVEFFGIPVVSFIGRLNLDNFSNELNGYFWRQLVNSFNFAFSEAFLSVLAVCTFASLLAVVFFLIKIPKGLVIVWQVLAVLAFAVPGVVWAIYYLSAQMRFPFLPSAGLWPIVLVHTAMNFLIVSYSVYEFLFAVFGSGVKLNAMRSLGAGPFGLAINLSNFAFKYAFKNWSLLVFLWSFMSFSVVLVLGGQARFSTPEVLLFYNLQDVDYGHLRIMVLWLLQFLFVLALFKFKALKGTNKTSMNFMPSKSEDNQRVYLVMLALAGVVIAIVSFQYSLDWAVLAEPLQNSLLLMGFSIGFCYFLFNVLIFCSDFILKCLNVFWAFSAVSILIIWSRGQMPMTIGLGSVEAFLVTALGVNFSLLPLMGQWIVERRLAIKAEQRKVVLSLGGTHDQYINLVFRYQCRDILKRVLMLSAVFSVGDLVFSSVLLWRHETLSVFAAKAASRYQFEYLPLVNILIVTIVFFMITIFQIKRTGTRLCH